MNVVLTFGTLTTFFSFNLAKHVHDRRPALRYELVEALLFRNLNEVQEMVLENIPEARTFDALQRTLLQHEIEQKLDEIFSHILANANVELVLDDDKEESEDERSPVEHSAKENNAKLVTNDNLRKRDLSKLAVIRIYVPETNNTAAIGKLNIKYSPNKQFQAHPYLEHLANLEKTVATNPEKLIMWRD